MLKVIVVLLGIAILYVVWQIQELRKFQCTQYEICTDKLTEEHGLVVLSDIHLWNYGKNNERLLHAIREKQPQAILLPGDLIVDTKPERFFVAEMLVKELVNIAPVYFANGNHESRLEQPTHPDYDSYQRLKQKMLQCGVHVLNNEQERLMLGTDELYIHGLELPLMYYKKGVETPLASDELANCIGEITPEGYHILLAHTPKYIPEYMAWGADLSLSGHYHGGLVCVPGIGSIISPQFEWFPAHSFGRFDFERQTALVSRGLGTHTFHIRIFNRSEMLYVVLKPSKFL